MFFEPNILNHHIPNLIEIVKIHDNKWMATARGIREKCKLKIINCYKEVPGADIEI